MSKKATITTSKPLDVYVVSGKRKPVKTGKTVTDMPQTFVHEGTTYYFSNACLVDGTATYTNVPLTWQ